MSPREAAAGGPRFDVPEWGRKAFAELLGSALLAATVVGSGIAVHWFTSSTSSTSSTSFANPAITVSRTLSGMFAGIAPSSVPMFVVMQLVGGALGVAAAMLLYPRPAELVDELHPPRRDRRGG